MDRDAAATLARTGADSAWGFSGRENCQAATSVGQYHAWDGSAGRKEACSAGRHNRDGASLLVPLPLISS